MEFKREWRPAHTEYFLIGENTRMGRVEYYNGQVYRTEKLAQRDADKFNARRNIKKAGRITVGSKEREAAFVTFGTLQL